MNNISKTLKHTKHLKTSISSIPKVKKKLNHRASGSFDAFLPVVLFNFFFLQVDAFRFLLEVVQPWHSGANLKLVISLSELFIKM